MNRIIFIAIVVLVGCRSSVKEGYSTADTLTHNTSESDSADSKALPQNRFNTDSTVGNVINSQVRDTNVNPVNR